MSVKSRWESYYSTAFRRLPGPCAASAYGNSRPRMLDNNRRCTRTRQKENNWLPVLRVPLSRVQSVEGDYLCSRFSNYYAVYGLTWEGLVPIFNPKGEEPLQFGIQLRNFSSGPIRYHIEKFQVLIGDRTSPIGKPVRPTNFLPRGGARLYRTQAFKRESLKEFFGKKTTGTVEFSIAYGHPDMPPVRRLKMTLEINLEFSLNGEPPLGFSDGIIEESDEPINTPQ